MENFCISIRLASRCCDRNYLKFVCTLDAKVYQGRTYSFIWGTHSSLVYLCCNGIRIGVISQGQLGIYEPLKPAYLSKSQLLAIMALFNLYPY